MQIIDFEKKGNVVRFYLGKNGEQYGDDWNDIPYNLNAGRVYDEFIKGYKDVFFPFDVMVLEPCDGDYIANCVFSKEDMRSRKVPCIIAVPKEIYKFSWNNCFGEYVGADGIEKYYFGDEMGASDGVYGVE